LNLNWKLGIKFKIDSKNVIFLRKLQHSDHKFHSSVLHVKVKMKSTRRTITIAIDGPAGAGKSTVAREVSKRLKYLFIDSGAMYRAVTLKVLESNVNPNDLERVVHIANAISIKLLADDVRTKILIDGVDRSEDIRRPIVSQNVSIIANYPAVRKRMVELQQEYGKSGGVIMDGRDIGTVVFPNAELKIFMKADPLERAKRRLNELREMDPSNKSTVESIMAEIQDRDRSDESREVGPLKQAPDAIVVDTTHHTKEQSILSVLELVHERINNLDKLKGRKTTPNKNELVSINWPLMTMVAAATVIGGYFLFRLLKK